MGKLIVVPTPVGNLEDITLRAIRVLKESDFILAEDTRTTGKLLKHLEIETRMIAHHKFNEHKTLGKTLNLIETHKQIALVSDAGTPGISDPGFLLIRECISNGIEIECLPGATAFVPALVCSGFPTESFCFEGFLPPKKGRQKKLTELAEEKRTIILYESPYRLIKTLEQIKEFWGEERQVAVCREISKMYEEIARGNINEIISHFSAKGVKGEIVIVVEGKNIKPQKKES